jgi:hypothetical protein
LFYFCPIAGKLSELGIRAKSGRKTPFIETRERAKAKMKELFTEKEIKIQMKFICRLLVLSPDLHFIMKEVLL